MGIDVLVGTPGRIKDHLDNNKLDLSQLKHVVLDEVDQMLDMGFADSVEEILSYSYEKGLVQFLCLISSSSAWKVSLMFVSVKWYRGPNTDPDVQFKENHFDSDCSALVFIFCKRSGRIPSKCNVKHKCLKLQT